MSRRCGRAKSELGEDFFNEIIQHPVPLNMNTLTALKRCARWASISTSGWSTAPSLSALRCGSPGSSCTSQFGTDPAKASDKFESSAIFRRQIALRELKKIKTGLAVDLNYATEPGVLILHPSTPTIAPLNQGQLRS